ncbi:MAG: hypothetical protein WDO16_11205 [Bacteroidota bacterium]
MNERLPYEEQITHQLNDLPLPDENMAWADMKRRLEEDDDRRIVPFRLRGCGLWGLLAVVLLGIGWWLFRQYKAGDKKEETQKVQRIPQQETTIDKNKEDTVHITGDANDKNSRIIKPGIDNNKNDTTQTTASQARNNRRKTAYDNKIAVTATGGTTKKINKEETIHTEQIPGVKSKKNVVKKTDQVADTENTSITTAPGSKKSNPASKEELPGNIPAPVIKDSSNNVSTSIRKTDTIRVVKKDSVKKKDAEETVKNSSPKKDSAKTKYIYFSAGIAMHQLLPIDGQKLTPYNSQGRKGSLADYIPSVYFRMYKNDKWFLQAEFRYGAPQYNREILYRQKSVIDPFGINNTITSTKLKKTFYHQLPVSFNYFVLPNWSIGSGLVWNKFTSAVSVQDVIKRTIATGSDTAISLGTIIRSSGADSNFARSYFQALVETQFRWKRFSLGARYSFGLQPYLKFTLPGGTQQQEKNTSLQLFLRYELWRSKKIMK